MTLLIGIHHSTLNDIENGQIKKVDIDMLRLIAEELDLSLVMLLKAAGYSDLAFNLGTYLEEDKTTRDLKLKLEEYRKSELDLLDDASQKRNNVKEQSNKLFKLQRDLEMGIDKIDKEDIIKVLEEVRNGLKPSIKKYDYNKLPKKD